MELRWWWEVASVTALWVILVSAPLGAQVVSVEAHVRCEFPVPALPAAPPDPGGRGYADPHSVYEWDGGYENAHLGIGHLAVVRGAYYTWYEEVVLPLYGRPDGALVEWINRGYLEGPTGEHRAPLSGAGAVETEYEQQTLIVYERTPAGWLRIRARPPSPGSDHVDGTLWTHECLLSLGGAELRFEPWETKLSTYADGWAYFRTGLPHVLREGPGTDYPRIGVIGRDHELFIQEVSGHWARVRAREPAWTCVGSPESFGGTVREGWVRWWGEDRGPWTWFPTRGC